MVKLSVTTYFRGCEKDADCWTVSTTPVMAAITTDLDKAKSCCMYFGVTAVPSGSTTEIAAGETLFTSYKTAGFPIVVGEATKYCNRDYTDTYTDALAKTGVTVVDNVITYPAA